MKAVFKLFFALVTLALLTFCGPKGTLTQEKATEAAIAVVTMYNNSPDQFGRDAYYRISPTEWLGLIQSSETKIELRGTVVDLKRPQRAEAKGQFIFVKTVDGKWILDNYHFSGPGWFWSGDKVSYIVP